MRYLSVCSGIEAATCAWHHMGWEPAGFAEIEPFPSAVLAHHYPNVPNFGDFTKISAEDVGGYGTVDLLVGGTPCQAFSVAGRRLGLDDPRGNLAIEYVRLANRIGARWLVWENVPGVLSSNDGRDFGAFLGVLGDGGYEWAYAVYDAQFFGVPQRRRRVFLVGYIGDWRPAAAVLFESQGLRWHPAPRRAPRKGAAAVPGQGAQGGGGSALRAGAGGGQDGEGEALRDVVPTLGAASGGGSGFGNHWDMAGGLEAVNNDLAGTLTASSERATGTTQDGNVVADVAPTLCAHHSGGGMGTDFYLDGGLLVDPAADEVSATLRAGYGLRGDGCDNILVDNQGAVGFSQWNDPNDINEQSGTMIAQTLPLVAIPYEARGGHDEDGEVRFEHGEEGTANCLRSGRQQYVNIADAELLAADTDPISGATEAVYELEGGEEVVAFQWQSALGTGASEEQCPTLIRNQVASVAIPPQSATIRMREGKEGGGKGPLVNEDQSLTLTAGNDLYLYQEDEDGEGPVVYDGFQATAPHIKQNPKPDGPCHTLHTQANQTWLVDKEEPQAIDTWNQAAAGVTHTLRTSQNRGANDDAIPAVVDMQGGKGQANVSSDRVPTLGADPQNMHAVAQPGRSVIRRLTPVECERLQAFADDYTRIPWKGKPAEECPDGPRYKALGNSMCVNVMAWIGERIHYVESVIRERDEWR